MPTTKKQQLVLPHDPNGYGWHGVTSHLVLPQAKMDNLCRVCLAECAGVVLYAHLLKTLILSSSLQEEYKMAVKTIRWSVQLKPKLVSFQDNSVTMADIFLIRTLFSLSFPQVPRGRSRGVPYLGESYFSFATSGTVWSRPSRTCPPVHCHGNGSSEVWRG